MEQFGARVIALRQQKGWSRRCLAQKATLHEFHLSKVERGERTRVAPETIIKLAAALDCTTDYLLGVQATPRPCSCPTCQPSPASR